MLTVVLSVIFFVLCLSTLLSVIDVVNRRLWREKGWLRAWLMPVLLVIMSIGVYVWIEIVEPGYVLKVITVLSSVFSG